MAENLLNRLRGQLSSRTDDYFTDEDLVDYLNESYKGIVSSAIKLELEQPYNGGRSIRALDMLRVLVNVDIVDTESFRNFKKKEINIGTNIENGIFLKELYVGATSQDYPLPMSELVSNRRHMMDFGLIQPTEFQGYYEFTGKEKIVVYLCNEQNVTIHILAVKEPTGITGQETTLPDLPSRLISAVVLGACVNAGVQEIRENAEVFHELYKFELQEHVW